MTSLKPRTALPNNKEFYFNFIVDDLYSTAEQLLKDKDKRRLYLHMKEMADRLQDMQTSEEKKMEQDTLDIFYEDK